MVLHFFQKGKFEQKKSRTELQKIRSNDYCGEMSQSRVIQMTEQHRWLKTGIINNVCHLLICSSACCHNMPTSSKEILSSYCHAWWVGVRACLFAWMEVKLGKVSNTTPGHRIKSLLSVPAPNCTQVQNKGWMPLNWRSTLYCINFNLIWSKKEEQTGNSLKAGSTYKSVDQLVQAEGGSQISTPITLKSKICWWVNGTHNVFPLVIEPDKDLGSCQQDFVFNASLCKYWSSFREHFCIF